jgi:Uma2 family endonuclease
VTIPPDIAIEVTSPNDVIYELEEKVEEYLRAGVRLIWLIHPEVRVIQVIRGDGSGYRLRAGDELSGEDVVPGFRCPVASLFPAAWPTDAGENMQGPSAS